jgi:ubiquinone/menaquinone biosynthesis C-methylase UbiE
MPKTPIEKYYDSLAPLYDEATLTDGAWTAPSECFQLLQPYIHAGLSVLDLGVGTGQSSQPYAKRGCKVVGVNISSQMLTRASRRLASATLLRSDIEQPLAMRPPELCAPRGLPPGG